MTTLFINTLSENELSELHSKESAIAIADMRGNVLFVSKAWKLLADEAAYNNTTWESFNLFRELEASHQEHDIHELQRNIIGVISERTKNFSMRTKKFLTTEINAIYSIHVSSKMIAGEQRVLVEYHSNCECC